MTANRPVHKTDTRYCLFQCRFPFFLFCFFFIFFYLFLSFVIFLMCFTFLFFKFSSRFVLCLQVHCQSGFNRHRKKVLFSFLATVYRIQVSMALKAGCFFLLVIGFLRYFFFNESTLWKFIFYSSNFSVQDADQSALTLSVL